MVIRMGKKILLVDDAAFMRKMIKDTLSKNGYTELFEAEDGADAVEKYSEIHPDLVIMDITMPNMDGLEALKAKGSVTQEFLDEIYAGRAGVLDKRVGGPAGGNWK